MLPKILIPQEIVTFKESDKEEWHQELRKKDPFKSDNGIISSNVPHYNRQKTIEKAIERPERYFRECCVINAYSPRYKKAYYTHSIHLLYSSKWMDQFPPKELFQKELFDDIHNKNYFPPDRLAEAQERFLKSDYLLEKNLKPKLPDVWLVKKYPESLFIEVKRLKEPFQGGQKEGLAIIKKYLQCDVRVARVCAESEAHSGLKFKDIDITDIYYEI